jgi:hypothetical protein
MQRGVSQSIVLVDKYRAALSEALPSWGFERRDLCE